MSVDPALMLTAVATVAIVLLFGAWQKLRDVMAFEMAIEAYDLLPDTLLKPVTWLLPLAEITAALLLVSDRTRTAGALLALTLLGVVTAGVAINLLRGRRDVGCGCGGLEDEQPISWMLVGRNIVLALMVATSFAADIRPLGWLDYLTVGAGAVCAYGLYVLVNQLLANQPRLMRLRSAS